MSPMRKSLVVHGHEMMELDMLKTCMEFAKEQINAKRRFLFEN